MKNLTNFKKALKTFRIESINQLQRIDRMMIEVESIEKLSKACPRCYSRNIRMMKNNQSFCVACGYDSKEATK